MQKPKTKQFDKTAKNREGWLKGLAPFIALAVLLILNALFVKNFAAIEIKDGRLYGSIIDIFHRATPVLLVAIGMTLVIATKGIDLSVGAVMAIAGTVSAILLTQT
ncbi:MAG TPA: ABC transporter permease, partial [Armatimonadota bacterium]|nr:ABC transporter permease [Armatimonadota bacterium]